MPIYEYRCEACGEELEKLQRLADAPLRDCPNCGKPALKRLVSAAGFRLKGSGWYETDFKKDGRRNLAGDDKPKSDGKGEGASTGGGEGKAATEGKPAADSKPAAKPVETKAAKPSTSSSTSA